MGWLCRGAVEKVRALHKSNRLRPLITQTTCRGSIKPPIEPVGQSATLMSALKCRSVKP